MNNQFYFIGRITRDIDLYSSTSGKSVIDVSIAINNKKDDTTFINVRAFNKLAEIIQEYCKKGDLIGLRGKVKNNIWEDKENKKHYDFSFIADDVIFLQTKKEKKENKNDSIDEQVKDFADEIVLKDEDLPF